MRIAIIGGGATGTLAAVHLARRLAGAAIEIVVIDPGERIGRGRAYSTDDPRHLLNVRVANMSAFPDEPQHLNAWLGREGMSPPPTPFCFISRGRYGDYLAALASEVQASGVVRHLRDECVDIVEDGRTATVRLKSGRGFVADAVVLATGADVKPAVNGFPAEQPWTSGSLDGLPPNAPILIVGDGLAMVDMALSLDRRGRRGPIVVVSRRGLRPVAHVLTPARALPEEEIPFGADLSRLLAWLRELAARWAADGADWRTVVDALRPHTQALWRAMTLDQRRRFLRHARPYWEVHRHRLAPEIAVSFGRLILDGRVRPIAGKVTRVDASRDGFEVTIARRGGAATERRVFARIIDCTGLPEQPSKSSNLLLQALMARGMLRPDPLGVGFDIAEDYAIVGASGVPSRRVRAIGPLARAAFWECIAIPDIRLQCRDLAAAIAVALPEAATTGVLHEAAAPAA